jgi:peptidyl-prolyl cis-trans isomerase D
MITWIQTYFQKHFRTIFAILLGVIIVTFVFTFNASGGFGHSAQRPPERNFFGYNLAAENEGGRLMRDGAESAQLQGQYRLTEGMIQQYALTRIAALHLADQHALPQPTEKEISAHIASLPIFQNEQGVFDQARYTQFADYLKNNPRFTVADANRVFRDDTRIGAVQKLIGGPGYVLPADIREFLTRTDSKYSVSIASLDFKGFNPEITVNDEVLQKHLADNPEQFKIQKRLRTSVILFNAADFLPAGALPEDQLRAYYNTNLDRFPVPAEAATPALPNPATAGADNFVKVRPQVEAAYRQELGHRAAVEAANKFTIDLYGLKAKANSAEISTFLTAQKRSVLPLEPFNQENPPKSLPWLAYYARQFAGLGEDKHFSDPIESPMRNGVVVLLWNESLPEYQPTLAEVRDKVASAYTNAEKTKRFYAEGQSLQARLAAAVKSGGKFEQAATDAKLEVKSFNNFTLMDPPKELPAGLGASLDSLKPGEVSPMARISDKGHFVLLVGKTPPDLTPANPRYAEMRSRIMEQIASSTSGAYLAQMVKTELDRTAPREAKAPAAAQ